MASKVYLLVGVPGVGKSWVAEQLKDRFDYVRHDDFIGAHASAYVDQIFERSITAGKPVLAEAPFSVSQTKEPLEEYGVDVVPVFILEDEEVLSRRYESRDGAAIPTGHLTRQRTYASRASEWGSFRGTSAETLEHLRRVEGDFNA